MNSEFVHEIKTKERFVREISKIPAQILNQERNLCTDLNKPTKLHEDRHSKTSSFDNFLVNLSRQYRSFQPTVVFVRVVYRRSVSYILCI